MSGSKLATDLAPPLAGALDLCPDAVLIFDEQGCVLHHNTAAGAFFGPASATLAGQPADRLPGVGERIGRWLAEPAAPPEAFRCELPGPSGASQTVEARLGWVTDGGRRMGCLFLRDVTERQRMEHALVRSQKTQALGALLEGVAHGFNNHATAVLSYLELMKDAPEFPASLRLFLDNAKQGARGSSDLMRQLQTYSRLSAAAPGCLELAPLLRDLISLLRHSLGRATTVHDLALPPEPLLVWGDPGQLFHVLVNLCLNAREAMPKGGDLRIGLAAVDLPPEPARPPRRAGPFVRISVSDTGTGLSEENRARLFAPFFTTRPQEKGLGLGLTIAARIVAAHHGWMEAESQPGAGTTVHVFLPRHSLALETAQWVPDATATRG